jgi:hypothetical protein
MTDRGRWRFSLALFWTLAWCVLIGFSAAHADPSKYPAFAQQTLPEDIKPEFISIDELVKLLQAGGKPVIIDVRSAEEFRELHILSAVSAPLPEFKDHLKGIPRDRPVVLY